MSTDRAKAREWMEPPTEDGLRAALLGSLDPVDERSADTVLMTVNPHPVAPLVLRGQGPDRLVELEAGTGVESEDEELGRRVRRLDEGRPIDNRAEDLLVALIPAKHTFEQVRYCHCRFPFAYPQGVRLGTP